jgi:L-iditol 2-dehydrogenase
MLAAVLTDRQRIELEERAVPDTPPGHARVRVSAVGVCGSDRHMWGLGEVGGYDAVGLVLGHEVCGVVDALGDGVTTLTPGQRVVVEPGVPCRSCRVCLSGSYHLCRSMEFMGTPALVEEVGPVDGALCEYVTMPEDFLFPLPDAIGDEAAVMIEPLAVALAGLRALRVSPRDDVLVMGAGALGMITMLAALWSSGGSVTVAARPGPRLALAAELGALTVPSDRIEPESADVLLDTTGHASVLAGVWPAMRRGGRVGMLGGGANPSTVDAFTMHIRELSLHGLFRDANDFRSAVKLAASGLVPLDRLPSRTYGLDRIDDAMRASDDDARPHVKDIIIPGRRG